MAKRPQQERRKAVRRQADRDLLLKVEKLISLVDRRGGDDAKERERQRRRTIRHNCKVGIDMLIGHAAGYSDTWSVDAVKVKGRVLDLSTGGAALYTKQPFDTGQELRLTIVLPEGGTVNTHATVRWVKAMPEKQAYASGVQFVHVTDADQALIEGFLAELDATAGLLE